ncbi:hypothetical protein GQ457_17G024250 [Hibiscus cannabinus]
MKSCELCMSAATTYCESDQASLCWHCDAKVHGANFLVTPARLPLPGELPVSSSVAPSPYAKPATVRRRRKKLMIRWCNGTQYQTHIRRRRRPVHLVV